ncbi:HSF-type DNA-binding-domain-containing protein [Melampsora americana]|nr:HSF-type DNA-binding-domain-containing protein [Melampsora americana]
MQSVQSCPGLPYISKTHQHHPNARRSTPLSPHNELVSISNHSRGDSTSGPSRIMSPIQPKNDLTEVSDSLQSLQIRSEGAEVKEPSPPAASTAFISKLYHLCSHDDYHPYIRWNSAGDAFVLAHGNVDFASVVLPRFFRHSNVSSFIRQLNLYNFTRLPIIKLLDTVDKTSNSSPASCYSGFCHPNFQRGDIASLKLIKPKPSKSKAARKACKDASSIEDKTKVCRRSTPAKSKLM